MEHALRRATDAIRYILIAYINSREIPLSILTEYVGKGLFIHGAKGLSLCNKLDFSSLKQHFLTDIPLAKLCFENKKLEESIVKLRDVCVRGIESSRPISSLTKLIMFLGNMYSQGVTSIRLPELKHKVRTRLKLSADVDELIAYLAILFPAAVKVMCGSIDVHEYLVNNFETLKKELRKSHRYGVAALFINALYRACRDPDSAHVNITAPLIKFRESSISTFLRVQELLLGNNGSTI